MGKRVVFGNDNCLMRINIAVLDRNEIIERPITSRQLREAVMVKHCYRDITNKLISS